MSKNNYLSNIEKFKPFKIMGFDFAYTHFLDGISMYSFGCSYNDNGTVIDTTKYWHKVGFGLYRRSESWLN